MTITIFIRKIFTFLRLISGGIRYSFMKSTLPKIMEIDETIDYVIANKVSVARFGDSEYLYMSGGSDGVQVLDRRLSEKLKDTLQSNNSNLLVCLVDYTNLTNKTNQAKMSARMFHANTFNSYRHLLDYSRIYGNSNMTRFYIGSVNKEACGGYFDKCKLIWHNRDIVIFEGEKTRFGVGNDLFTNTKSIRRVLCPSKQAFVCYDEIVEKAKEFNQDCLMIFALGATATVAAYDLTISGFQVIDIGNLDIEYEWYRLGVNRKVAIEGKQVSEVVGGTIIGEVQDSVYLSQIVGRIGIA